MNKAEALQELERETKEDLSLPLRAANLVFGEGRPDAEVLFIGEAPGFHEDRLGRPFVGRAGQLLDELIREVGWRREDVYITNIVKRRPPENRDPLPEEIEAYKPCLVRQIEIIAPKLIVALGRFAMNYFLPEAKISRDRGRVFRFEDRLLVPLLHPAAALRSTEMLRHLRDDFKKLPDVLSGKTSFEAPTSGPEEKSARKIREPQSKLF